MTTGETTFAARLHRLAATAGGISALARSCGISPSTLAGYVSGRFEPRVSELLKIAAASSVSVDWLVNGGPASEPKLADDASLWEKMTVLGFELCREAGVLDRITPRKFASIVAIMYEVEINSEDPSSAAAAETDAMRLRKFRRLLDLV